MFKFFTIYFRRKFIPLGAVSFLGSTKEFVLKRIPSVNGLVFVPSSKRRVR